MSAPPNKKRRYSYQLVTFKVEDEIYRVPRHGFTEFSEAFRAMFALPQPEGTRPEEGQCDENPIVLPECTKLELESLLEVLYPMARSLQPEPLGKGQWIDVLKLSGMWSMDQVREVAIEELSKLATDPMTRAILAKRYRIPHWLAQAYKGVVEGFLANVWTCEQLHGCLGWDAARLLDLAVRAKRPIDRQVRLMFGFTCSRCQKTARVDTIQHITVELFVRLLVCQSCRHMNLRLNMATLQGPVPDIPLEGDVLQEAVEVAFKEEIGGMQ